MSTSRLKEALDNSDSNKTQLPSDDSFSEMIEMGNRAFGANNLDTLTANNSESTVVDDLNEKLQALHIELPMPASCDEKTNDEEEIRKNSPAR